MLRLFIYEWNHLEALYSFKIGAILWYTHKGRTDLRIGVGIFVHKIKYSEIM